MHGDADGSDPAGGGRVLEPDVAAVPDTEQGDRVAPGVDREEPVAVEDERALRAEPAPVPLPPVGTVRSGVSDPSDARSKIATALPDAEFVSVYTAPPPDAMAGAAGTRKAAARTAAATSVLIGASRFSFRLEPAGRYESNLSRPLRRP